MNKRKPLNIITALCYLVVFIFALVLCITLRTQINGVQSDGTGNDLTYALTGVVLVVVLFLAIIYACMALVPLTVKSIQIFFDRPWISILCITFDMLLCCMHVALLANVFKDGAEFSFVLVMLFLCAFLSLGALSLNIFSLTPLFSQSRANKEGKCENNV
jgi:hypothetical protein